MKLSTTISRRGFLKGAGSGTLGAAAAGGLLGAPSAQAAVSLDANYSSPYPPYATIAHPSSWNVYTGLTRVVIPAGVFVCNRQLQPMPDIHGLPDLGYVPSDSTLLCLYQQELPAGFDTSLAMPLNGSMMSFSDLGGGTLDQPRVGFRQFAATWVATVDGNAYNLQVFVYIAPDAGAEWAEVQPIVDSIQLPA